MRTDRGRLPIALVLILSSLLLFAALAPAAMASDAAVVAQEDTTPPETEPPPSETTPAEGEQPEEDGGVPSWGWVLIIGGVIILILIFVAAAAGSRQPQTVQVVQPAPQPAPAPVPAPAPQESQWQRSARDAYGKARWLFTVMTPDAALAHGDARFRTEVLRQDLSADDNSGETRWREMEETLRDTSFQLYGLETNPPSPDWGKTGTAVAGSLNTLRQALESAASAQLEYRKAENTEGADRESAYRRRLDSEAVVRQSRTNLEASLNALKTIV